MRCWTSIASEGPRGSRWIAIGQFTGATTTALDCEWTTGEPDALKGASPVRRGAVGKVPVTPKSCRETDIRLGNSLAAYPTLRPTGTDRPRRAAGDGRRQGDRRHRCPAGTDTVR